MREIEYPYSGATLAGPSWGAVFAGSFVAVAGLSTLSMLGLGLGFAGPAAEAPGLGFGSVSWLLASGVASFYAGGWVTGRLTRTGLVSESVVHATVTWAFATTLLLFLLTSALGSAFGGAAGLLGSAVGQAAVPPGEEPPLLETFDNAGARAVGIAVFVMMFLELLACAAGGRAGTRLLKPRPIAAARVRETSPLV